MFVMEVGGREAFYMWGGQLGFSKRSSFVGVGAITRVGCVVM